MLNEDQMKDKLRQKAEMFRKHYARKDWYKAKIIYEETRTLSVGAEMGNEFMDELFGSREHETACEALFPENMVQKCFYEISVKKR